MKKIISVCAIALISTAAICQDTTLQKTGTTTNVFDTIPNGSNNNMLKDSSRNSMNQGNKNWNSDSTKRNTWSNSNDTMPGANGKANSMDTSGQQQPMEGSRDAFNRGDSSGSSKDTLYKNQQLTTDKSKSDSTDKNTNANTTTNSNAGGSKTTADSVSTEKVTDRIAMMDDKVYMIKNGDSSILSKEYKLSSGAVILADGTVKYPTGKSVMLKNGQFIELPKKTTTTSDGEKMPAKKKSSTKPAKKSTKNK